MNKAAVLLIVGLTAVLVQGQTINCPFEDENSLATYYPHQTECGKFYECASGIAKLLVCPEGLYWNQRLNVCDWDVDCGHLLTSTATVASATASIIDHAPDS